jgi:hypothetical protein
MAGGLGLGSRQVAFPTVRTIFVILFVALIVLVAVVVVGPTLPEGNAIRSVGDSIRELFAGMGNGFGGGYQPMTPSG